MPTKGLVLPQQCNSIRNRWESLGGGPPFFLGGTTLDSEGSTRDLGLGLLLTLARSLREIGGLLQHYPPVRVHVCVCVGKCAREV